MKMLVQMIPSLSVLSHLEDSKKKERRRRVGKSSRYLSRSTKCCCVGFWFTK